MLIINIIINIIYDIFFLMHLRFVEGYIMLYISFSLCNTTTVLWLLSFLCANRCLQLPFLLTPQDEPILFRLRCSKSNKSRILLSLHFVWVTPTAKCWLLLCCELSHALRMVFIRCGTSATKQTLSGKYSGQSTLHLIWCAVPSYKA